MLKTFVMSDEEFQLMNEFLSEHMGMIFPEHKREILESRLQARLVELGFKHFMEYYVLLSYNANGEIRQLARHITNNETYFFREDYQIKALFEHGLDRLKEQNKDSRRFEFLSAGCSSGEEPYTLNIQFRENQFRCWGYEADIDAFDIDMDRLQIARKAEYGKNSLREVQEEQVQRYFLKSSSDPDKYVLKPNYRQGVRFVEGNILETSTYRLRTAYDLILCRNVLIYFSEASLHRAIMNFASCLRKGGYLFLGHSESIIGLTDAFEPVRLGNCIVYVKK